MSYCELVNSAGDAATPYSAVGGACSADQVRMNDLGLYVENTTHWTGWLRTVLGFRWEDYRAADRSLTLGIKGARAESLPQPKASLIAGPWLDTEVYFSAGQGFHSNDAREVFLTVPYEGGLNPNFRPGLLSKSIGEEVGVRSNLVPKLQVQVVAFQEDFSSEQIYDQDQGEDQASAPSRRQGLEVSAQYQPARWIELNADLAFSRARYRDSLADLHTNFGIDGRYIANAPAFVGSFGALVDHVGPWFGGLQWRALGPYPVTDGARLPQDKGYSEVNIDAGYKVNSLLKVQLAIFNLFNTRANAGAYSYASRLTPGGSLVDGPQVHPLEPVSARITATASF